MCQECTSCQAWLPWFPPMVSGSMCSSTAMLPWQSLYWVLCLDSDTHHTQSIGTSISHSTMWVSARRQTVIKMHREWAIAFAATKALYSMPTSLLINNLQSMRNLWWVNSYAFIDPSQHQRIIHLDCAIHLCIACSRQTYPSTKFDRFGNLITHHIIIASVWQPTRISGPPTEKITS